MQKESEADSGLYSDINRSIGKPPTRCSMFYQYYRTAPAEVENVFDDAGLDTTTVARPVPQTTLAITLNPAIEAETSAEHIELQLEPDSVSKKDEKSMTPARRWAAIRYALNISLS